MTSRAGARDMEFLGLRCPIVQAPMAGCDTAQLAAAVSEAGGLGSLACALLSPAQIGAAVEAFRAISNGPLNLNFFCHTMDPLDEVADAAWGARLAPYYEALGIDPHSVPPAAVRRPFDDAACGAVETLKPQVVSFHFGLPQAALLDRVKRSGAAVLSSATSVEEALWLQARGCDAIIAQGAEAGGHRGMFLARDPAKQVGTMALVPQIVDAVDVPVIAAGGIGDARGIAAARFLGAAAVQLGTAYLFCPEAKVSPLYLRALQALRADGTVLTNVFSGHPARGIANRFVEEVGPLSDVAPRFPHASERVAPLRAASEAAGTSAFMQMWAGQGAPLCRVRPAGELTRALAQDARALMTCH